MATVRLTMRVGLFKGGTTSLKRTKDELQREHIFDSLTRGTALRLPRSFTHTNTPSLGTQAQVSRLPSRMKTLFGVHAQVSFCHQIVRKSCSHDMSGDGLGVEGVGRDNHPKS